jgi:virginiamycin B lyase
MQHLLIKSLVLATGLTSPAYAQEDDGKELFEATCTSCHTKRTVEFSSGYTKEEWRNLISHMVDFSGAPELEEDIINYLAKTYPPNDLRASVVVPGPLKLNFREWKTPTLGQRTRDPVEAPDDIIWWVGQSGNILGKLNRDTGEMKEYMLPDGAMPHSVTIGPKGNPWYTGNRNGSVGYLDLSTEEIVEFPMPDPKARDPHTAIFDNNGEMWFTLQGSNMVGHLVPDTGEIRLKDMPRERSRPYGIKQHPNGDIYVACNGGDCLVKVDQDTMDMTLIKLPTEGTTVRRLAIDEHGIVWYVNSRKGKLGRYNPENGEIKEWPTPSGEKSHPYAIEVTEGAVWFNESAKRPETLVRFDPTTEKFQSWILESGGVKSGLLRHMRASKDGLILHQTSTNSIIEVSWVKGKEKTKDKDISPEE